MLATVQRGFSFSMHYIQYKFKIKVMDFKYKVKVKLPLCLTKHHAMKTYWGSGGIAPHILDLGIRLGEWLALRPGRFTPRERALGTHWIGG
jgi:hypothetical protein